MKKMKSVASLMLAGVVFAGCAVLPQVQEDKAVETPSVEAIGEDFRQSVQLTAAATGVPEGEFTYIGGQVYSAAELDGDLEDFKMVCGDRKDGGMLFSYMATIRSSKVYGVDDWSAQAERIRVEWERLGWDVKNAPGGTGQNPGITLAATTPAGVEVLYSVAVGNNDYIDVYGPCVEGLEPQSGETGTN